jgi:S-adenosylmethionine-dependent methyltransferase
MHTSKARRIHINAMKKMMANTDADRFQSGAEKYAAYLDTPEGRLRLDLAFANLQEFLPHAAGSLRVLDIGCGTGAIALRLARLGLHVTLLDSSPAMLDLAQRATQEAGITERILLKRGDAAELADLFPAGSFDVILCHNILEYVEDPGGILCHATRALRGRSGVMSVMVRNQAGDVLKAAIQAGDLTLAEKNLSSECGYESLYGGQVRLFTAEGLRELLKAASLVVAAERGVRVVSDYLPPQVSRTSEYDRIFDLESKLGRRPEFAAAARYTQCLVRRADAGNQNRV